MSYSYTSGQADSFGPLTTLVSEGGDYTWDFTLLFEDAILQVGPLLLGCCLIIIELSYKLWRKPRATATLVHHPLGWIKLTLYMALLIIGTYLSARYYILPAHNSNQVSKFTPGVATLTIIAACLIGIDNLFHHVYCLKPSSPTQLLLGWWMLSDIAVIRTRWLLAEESRTLASVVIALSIVKFSIIVVEEYSKRGAPVHQSRQVSPELLAGIYNRILMAWINPLMYKSLFTSTSSQALWSLEKQFSSEELMKGIKKQEGPDYLSKQRLLLLLIRQYKWMWLKPFPTRLAQAAFSFAQPYLIYQLLYWLFIPTADSGAIGYGLLAGFACSYVGVSLTTSFGQYQVIRLCAKLRGDLILRIYTKSLEIKTCEIQNMAALTLMSTNVDKFVEGMIVLQELIVSVLVVGIALWLLETRIGLGAIGPVVTVAAAAAVIGACVPGIHRAQKAWLDAVKRRVQFATQILAGYQTAKMSGLMQHLASELQRLRAVELNISLALRRYTVMTVSTSLGMPNVSPLMALAVYAAVLRNNGETLGLVNAFTALAFLNLITFPLMVILQTAPKIIQGYSSLTQVDEYLRTGIPPKQLPPLVTATGDVELEAAVDLGESAVVLQDCTFNRSIELKPVQKDFSLNVPLNSFTLIIGPSASGKSTLLEAILGEILRTTGSIHFHSDCQTKAYVAQRPWIRDISIRDNIILTSPYDDAWYREVLHACALDEDVARMNGADAGAEGAALSGGQKQKVSLARAIYSKRALIIIDEPFTGVDGTSCDQITQRLFSPTGLIRRLGSTLILASHSGRLLSQADHVLVLGPDRRITQQGIPRDLDLREYRYDRHGTPKDALRSADAEVINPTAYILSTKRQMKEHKTQDRRGGELAAYIYYFIALGPLKLVLVGAFVAIFAFFQLFTQPWVTWWTTSNLTDPNNNFAYWLGLYGLYAALAILALAAACWLMLVQMIKASGNSLHATLCDTIERAQITLFSTLSPGLTINRFSQDMSLVDMELPMALSSLAITGMVTLGQFGLVLSASRYIAAALPLTVAACVIIQRLYIKTSRQLRFHEIETKAPLYTQSIETLDGLATIRAYGLQTMMQDEMETFVDECQKAWYLLFCAQRYLGVTLNLTVAGLVVVLVGIAIAARGHTDTSFYGSSLVNTMMFGMYIAMTIDYWCNFEIGLAAVERTKEFSETTPLESTEVVDHDAETPFELGAVRIIKLSTGYQPTNNVVHQISCDIRPGQKVAICGRSGSGKTTLLFSLLRLLEANEGRIEIDARDISRIPHDDLRNNISCVPQHPLILDASIRSNVDVLNQYSDEEVSAALRKAGLHDAFAEQGLDTMVTAKALSHSESQLLCLARALIKQRKVLVLDEATSSLDANVDGKLQQVVCEDLPGVTVISVMHKFNHIRRYDRVILMSSGRILEDDTPERLLADSTSAFASLYQAEQMEY